MEKRYKFFKKLFTELSIICYSSLAFSLLILMPTRDNKSIIASVIFAVAAFVTSTLASTFNKKLKEVEKTLPPKTTQTNINFETAEPETTEYLLYTRKNRENVEINNALLNIGVKNKELLEDTLAEKVKRYLEAINSQNKKEIKDVCSSEISERTINSIEKNDQLGYDLKVEDIVTINSTIVDVIPIKKNPTIELKVIMTMKESIIKENGLTNSIQSSAKVYKVKFNKKDKSQKDYQCDNCGAELSALTDICPYCRTNTKFIEERNWFIASIKEVI